MESFSVSEICKSFGNNTVLEGVTFSIRSGTIAGLIGPSGGGKSVLLKILYGILEPDAGEIHSSHNHPVLMFQEGALFDSLTAFDNVAFPLVSGNLPLANLDREVQERVSQKVINILARVGLQKAQKKFPAELSGGMRRRLALARALVDVPDLVLLDDPIGGLDPITSRYIMNLIVEIQRETGSTMVIASHDLRRLLPAVDEVIALFHGKIAFQGTLAQLRGANADEVKRFVSCRYDLNTAIACSRSIAVAKTTPLLVENTVKADAIPVETNAAFTLMKYPLLCVR